MVISTPILKYSVFFLKRSFSFYKSHMGSVETMKWHIPLSYVDMVNLFFLLIGQPFTWSHDALDFFSFFRFLKDVSISRFMILSAQHCVRALLVSVKANLF